MPDMISRNLTLAYALRRIADERVAPIRKVWAWVNIIKRYAHKGATCKQR